jgi:hypothetical protein
MLAEMALRIRGFKKNEDVPGEDPDLVRVTPKVRSWKSSGWSKDRICRSGRLSHGSVSAALRSIAGIGPMPSTALRL